MVAEKLGTALQALLSGGSISGFILAVVPEGRLESGWIEQSLVSKGLQGGLDSKNNHHDYLIPADRTVRLIRDRGSYGRNYCSLFMTGEPGSDSRRFTLFQYSADTQTGPEQYACAFWSLGPSPSDVVSFLMRESMGTQTQIARTEPVLDYTEQLRTDASVGLVIEALSARVPSSRTKPADWLRSVLERPADTEAVPFRFGAMETTPDFAKLFAQWFVGLELTKRMKSPIAALTIFKEDSVDVALWDSPRNLCTFASVRWEDPVALVARYIAPLWVGPGETIGRPEPAPKPLANHDYSTEGSATAPPAEQLTLDQTVPSSAASSAQELEEDSYHELLARLETISLPDLQYRFSQMESQLRRLAAEQAAAQERVSAASDKAAIDLLQNRLRDALNRLEAIADRLTSLQERVERAMSEGN